MISILVSLLPSYGNYIFDLKKRLTQGVISRRINYPDEINSLGIIYLHEITPGNHTPDEIDSPQYLT